METLLGKTIGLVRTHQPFQYHDNSFETASWYQTTELAPGTYPLVVGMMPYGRNKPLTLNAEGLGTVVDAFFPSSFGGVMFGGDNKEKYIGNRNKIRMPIGWVKAIQTSGNSPSTTTPDIWIHESFLPKIEAYFNNRLQETLSGFDRMRPEGHNDREETGTIMHHAGWIVEDATILHAIQNLIWQNQTYRNTDYWRKLTEKNTEWAREIWATFQIDDLSHTTSAPDPG